jgi:hypothetical protein
MEEHSGGIRGGAADLGRRALALVILLAAAWILFKLVIGAVAAVAWIVVAVLAVVAIIWAIRVL